MKGGRKEEREGGRQREIRKGGDIAREEGGMAGREGGEGGIQREKRKGSDIRREGGEGGREAVWVGGREGGR